MPAGEEVTSEKAVIAGNASFEDSKVCSTTAGLLRFARGEEFHPINNNERKIP
jgi:exosome complex RNA-binding protein Rrp4